MATRQRPTAIWWAFPLLISVYMASAWNMVILDCDETFNYLEPLHYMLYGHGLQTWEYGQQFALRPYSFLLLFSTPLKILIMTFGIRDKVVVFKLLRAMIGVLSAYSQSHLIESIAVHISSRIAKLSIIIFAATTGMFVSSTAFLPNSFSMTLMTLVWSFWLRGHDSKVILLTAVSAVLGWPYSIIGAIIPIAFSFKQTYELTNGDPISVSSLEKRIQFELFFRRLVLGIIFGLVYVLCPTLIVERYYYGRWVCPSLNAMAYNIVGSSGGPGLYGTEPWHYYILNMALNFSLCFPAAFLAPVATIFSDVKKQVFLLWLNFSLPFVIFSFQAHKEERFLYTFYPLVCVSIAFALDFVCKLHKSLRPLMILCLFGGMLIGVSRTIALIKFYAGPQTVLEAWMRSSLYNPSTVCMSSSWYRFPGSFYLGNSDRLGFIEGASNGQLPMYFTSTSSPVLMNNMNKAIDTQFTDRNTCDLFLGLETNPGLTKAPFKWLWIPYFSEEQTKWDLFCIYRNNEKTA